MSHQMSTARSQIEDLRVQFWLVAKTAGPNDQDCRAIGWGEGDKADSQAADLDGRDSRQHELIANEGNCDKSRNRLGGLLNDEGLYWSKNEVEMNPTGMHMADFPRLSYVERECFRRSQMGALIDDESLVVGYAGCVVRRWDRH